jgi:hypothetical protein
MATLRRGNPRAISINRSHPAARYLQFLAVPLNGNMVDIASRQIGTAAGSVSSSMDAICGQTINVNTATTTKITFPNRPTVGYTQGTWAAVVVISNAASVQQYICSDNVPGTSGSGLGIGSTNLFQFNIASGILNNTLVPAVTGGVYFIVGSFAQKATGTLSTMSVRRLDTTLTSGSNSNTTTTPTPGGTISLGLDHGTNYFHGNICWVLQSYTYITRRQHALWARNPWSIFESENFKPSFFAGSSLPGQPVFNTDFPTPRFVIPNGAALNGQLLGSPRLLNLFAIPDAAFPIRQMDWPLVVQAKTLHQGAISQPPGSNRLLNLYVGQDSLPNRQRDWPLPTMRVRHADQTTPLGSARNLNLLFGADAFPARQRDWPNPAPRRYATQSIPIGTPLVLSTLAGKDAFPVRQMDWPLSGRMAVRFGPDFMPPNLVINSGGTPPVVTDTPLYVIATYTMNRFMNRG